ncbi:hypothetical protein IW261DRAFT_1575176 [Armillaria novae-zelandiae]|uniref:Uncharacterized protein n=1 Tax=Armillaria novae-zelandiae TaxID=153914 RepID=A0AA39U0V9_9AGAR|nr:hypothetical protein IW261DRAFT_1575176 [Armillaria novae-zelandiae]
MQLKKIFDRIKKELQVRHGQIPRSAQDDQVRRSLRTGRVGVLIQPTPQNKPKSAVTIIHFNTKAQIAQLFGDELKALIWIVGGREVRAPSFAKSVNLGACDVEIR